MRDSSACLLACLLALAWQKSSRLSTPFWHNFENIITNISCLDNCFFDGIGDGHRPLFQGSFRGLHKTASNSGVATLRNFHRPQARENACWGAPQTR